MNASPLRRADWAIAAALLLAAFLLVALTANAYGPTYDEPHYTSAGLVYAQWWGRVLRGDFSALHADQITAAWHYNHEHPPLQKVASGISQALFGGISSLAPMRLPSALWFGMVVAALYLFLLPLWGRPGALFSALALASLPRLFAHAHLVALDMPMAAWFFLTVAATAVALERDSWLWTVLAGVAFGLALAAKVNAFFLPVLLIPWGLLWYRPRWRKLLAALLLIGPAVFFLSWPWLWIAPVSHFRDYLAFHFGHAAYNVWYLGQLYQYAPWHYPFVMTAVTTPALVLLCSVIGFGFCWPRRGQDPRKALLLLGLAVALLPNALPSSPKYNGVRLFLPALPFLVAMAGGPFTWVLARVRRATAGRPEAGRLTVLATLGLGALVLGPGMQKCATLHPYQLAYYNELVGGTWGATQKGFETIYWGQALQEAALFLNSVPVKAPRVLVIPKGVIYLFEFQQRGGNLRPEVQLTGDEAQAGSVDYVAFQAMESDFTDLCWALTQETEPVYVLTADDAPLVYVFDRAAVATALARLKQNKVVPDPSKMARTSKPTNSPTR